MALTIDIKVLPLPAFASITSKSYISLKIAFVNNFCFKFTGFTFKALKSVSFKISIFPFAMIAYSTFPSSLSKEYEKFSIS